MMSRLLKIMSLSQNIVSFIGLFCKRDLYFIDPIYLHMSWLTYACQQTTRKRDRCMSKRSTKETYTRPKGPTTKTNKRRLHFTTRQKRPTKERRQRCMHFTTFQKRPTKETHQEISTFMHVPRKRDAKNVCIFFLYVKRDP